MTLSSPEPSAVAASVLTGTTGTVSAKASPWATPQAIRKPVKLPGPAPKAIASTCCSDAPASASNAASVGSSVGYDHGRPVSDRYDDTFPFEGALCSLDIELVSAKRIEEREVAAAEERTGMGRQ